jgi:hypothetical protein
MTASKQQVIDALAELRVNRRRNVADHYIRSILRQFGNGAANINELGPAYYAAVLAAVTIPTAADHYGTVTDVPAPGRLSRKDARPGQGTVPPSRDFPVPQLRGSQRIKSPLTMDLEARLKERVGKPRSKPGGRVDLGNASRPEDQADDIPHDPPFIGTKMA